MVHSNLMLIMKYKKKNSSVWIDINISMDKYFDLEENEVAAVDSVTNYNHVIDYIKESSIESSLSDIEYTFLKIVDQETKEFFEVQETFWNDGNNRFIEVNSHENNQSCTEFIVYIEKQEACEIIRLRKDDECNKLLFHSFD